MQKMLWWRLRKIFLLILILLHYPPHLLLLLHGPWSTHVRPRHCLRNHLGTPIPLLLFFHWVVGGNLVHSNTHGSRNTRHNRRNTLTTTHGIFFLGGPQSHAHKLRDAATIISAGRGGGADIGPNVGSGIGATTNTTTDAGVGATPKLELVVEPNWELPASLPPPNELAAAMEPPPPAVRRARLVGAALVERIPPRPTPGEGGGGGPAVGLPREALYKEDTLPPPLRGLEFGTGGIGLTCEFLFVCRQRFKMLLVLPLWLLFLAVDVLVAGR